MFDLFRRIVWFVFGMSQFYLSCVNIYSNINTENPKIWFVLYVTKKNRNKQNCKLRSKLDKL